MRTILKDELYKMASRKIVWFGLFLLALFIGWRLFAERGSYTVTIDGQIYRGQQAINLDQQLTAGYAGIFTKQTAQSILEDFGFYYYDPQKDAYIGNFCNNYLTIRTTNYNQLNVPFSDQVQFQKEYWESNIAPLLNDSFVFDYTYGWNDLKETHSFITVMAMFVLFIIGLSPVFSEEYSLKTANILLSTKRGRQSGIWLKAAAALFLVTIVYSLFSVYLWLLYYIVYGTQGLTPLLFLSASRRSGIIRQQSLGFSCFPLPWDLRGWRCLQAQRF